MAATGASVFKRFLSHKKMDTDVNTRERVSLAPTFLFPNAKWKLKQVLNWPNITE